MPDGQGRPLIGRDTAVKSIEQAAGRGSGPTVIVVSGEAGIGKSCLVDHVVEQWRRDGRQILAGGCVDVSGEPIPYAPVTELLRRLRRSEVSAANSSEENPLESIIGSLLETRAGERFRDQGELFERTLDVIERVAARGDVVIVLEDLHWADEGTLDLIAFLVRNLTGNELLMLTYRSEDWLRGPQLRRLAETLARSRTTTRIELERMTRDDLDHLAEVTTGAHLTERELDRLVARSQGNPFIAEELLLVPRDSSDVPASVQDILLARATRIDADGEQLVRVAAVIGRPVAHDLLLQATGFTQRRLAAAIRQTVSSGLIVVDGVREEYSFRHVLTQDAVRDRILPAERRRLHQAVAGSLARLPDLRISASRSSEWAAHVLAAGEDEPGLAAALIAGRLAANVYAYAIAWRFYSRAVELFERIEGHPATDRPVDIYAEAAEAARWGGDLDAAVALAVKAVELAPDDAERARVSERAGRYLVEAGALEEAERAFQRAAELTESLEAVPLKATVAVSAARLLMQTGRYERAVPAARSALELATAAGATLEQGRAHTALGMSLVLLGDVEDGVANVRQGWAMIDAEGDLDDRRRADSNLSYALLIAGRTREACDVSISGLEAIRRHGLAGAGGGALTSNSVVLLRMTGRWDDAERLCDEAQTHGVSQGMALRILLARTELDIARGQLHHAQEQLDTAWGLAGELSSAEVVVDLHLAQAMLALGQGDFDRAAAAVERAAATDEAHPPRTQVRACLVAMRIEAERADGHGWGARSTPAVISPRISELDQRIGAALVGSSSPELLAYQATYEAEHSRARRRPEPQRWLHAASLWADLERPRGEAYCLMRLGEVELVLRRPASARDALTRAREIARGLGAAPIVEAIETIAQRGRVRLDTDRPSSVRSDSRPLGLTDRERQVLAELADGLSNRDIAAKLYLSPRTVGVHVSNVLAKLGARTRTEAAATAVRLKLIHEGDPP